MRRSIPSIVLLLAALAGCKDATPTAAPPQPPDGPENGPPPVAVVLVSGDHQRAGIDSVLPAALVVLVTDSAGDAVHGAEVAWAAGPGGGKLSPATSRTDATGHASAQWTLPHVDGAWTATATVGTLRPVTFHAAASGPVTIFIDEPQDNAVVDSLYMEFGVGSRNRLAQVGVTVDGAPVQAVQETPGGWYHVHAPLTGSVHDPRVVEVTAADTAGNRAVRQLTVHHDGPPRLTVAWPLDHWYYTMAGTLHVHATCDDDDGGCLSLKVTWDGRTIAVGDSVVDTAVSLVGYQMSDPQGYSDFVVTGTGAHGLTTRRESNIHVLPYGGGWTHVGDVGLGVVLDTDGQRAVYGNYADYGGGIYTAGLGSAAATRVSAGDSHSRAWVTDAGAVSEPQPEYGGGVHVAFLDGTAPAGGSDACCAQARDQWAAWWAGGYLYRENVVTHAIDHHVAVPSSAGFWLGDDGTVAYLDSAGGSWQLHALRPDGTTAQLTGDPARPVVWGHAEGASVLYARSVGTHTEVVFSGPGGEEVLNGVSDEPGMAAQLRGGWALWTTGDATGSHLWTRSPAGEVRLAASGSPTSKWVMGGDGMVLLLGGQHAYLAGPPYAGLVDVGPTFVYWSWHRGHFYAPWGIEVFRVGG